MVAYYLFRLQAAGDMNNSDLPQHLEIIDNYIKGNFYIPHPVFHLTVYFLSLLAGVTTATAAPIVMTLSVALTLLAVESTLRFLDGSDQFKLSNHFAALSLLFAIAIYLPFFSQYMYLGQLSPNIWHSQTMLMLRPVALLSFVLYVRFILLGKSDSLPGLTAGALLLFASTAIKPSFVITFIPALFIYHLLFHWTEKERWLKGALWLAPSVLLLAYQFIRTYLSAGTESYFHDSIIFTWFGFLKLHSPNLFISALLVLAFPLSVLFSDWQRALNNRYLLLSWLVTFVAYLQASFLAEAQKFDQGAFAFGYVNALFLLYIFSLQELMARIRSESTPSFTPANLVPLAIFSLHLFSGIIYFAKLLQGGNYL